MEGKGAQWHATASGGLSSYRIDMQKERKDWCRNGNGMSSIPSTHAVLDVCWLVSVLSLPLPLPLPIYIIHWTCRVDGASL